jgi:tetratricopeptide (TPR) repeat protein
LNNLGLILIARGDLDGARQHLDRSLELSEATELEVGRSHVLLSLCELCLHENNLDQAQTFAREALGLAERLKERSNVAESHLWLGRIADRTGDQAGTDHEFGLAIRTLEQLGTYERLFQCHGIYAEVLERRGDVARAYAHMKKALQASRPGLVSQQQKEEPEHASTA